MSASLQVVAGLVPATPIILAPPPYPPPHAGEGRVGEVAGTSPATTPVCDYVLQAIEIRTVATFRKPEIRGRTHEHDGPNRQDAVPQGGACRLRDLQQPGTPQRRFAGNVGGNRANSR